jgi:hypothetical protein
MKEEPKEIKQYNPTFKETETIKTVVETFESYKDQSRNYRDDWEDIYKAWSLYMDRGKYPWRSKVFIPLIFWSIESLAPKLLSDYPTLSAKATGAGDEVKADFISKFLDFQWRKTMDMRKKLLQSVESMLAYGVGIGKVYWRTETREYKKKGGKEKSKEVLYDDPVFEPKSIFDVYTDPKAPTLQESEYVIDRFELNYNDLMKMTDKYKNLEFVKGTTDSGLKSDGNETSDSIDHVDLNSASNGPRKVILLEAWTNDNVITLADAQDGAKGAVVLRDMPNPYNHGKKPFVSVGCYTSPETNRFYKPGVGKVLLGMQHGINTTVNQSIDNINLIINKMFKIRRGSNVDKKELISKPGGTVTLDDLREDLEELKMTDTTDAGKYLVNQFMSWSQSTSGSTDLLRGLESGDTATEASIQDKNANNRISTIQTNVEEFIAEIGEMIISLDQQYIQSTRTIRIFDEKTREDVYISLGEGQLDGEFDIEVEADSTKMTDKAVMNKQLLDASNIFGGDPEYGLNKQELAKRWFKNAGFNDIGPLFIQEQGQQTDMGMVRLAEDENQQMLNGATLPPTEGAPPEHTEAHMMYQETPAIAEHIEGELTAQEQGLQGPQAAAPQAPQGGTEYKDQVQSAYSPVTQL